MITVITVVQEKKDKARPVLDFQKLNKFVECSKADADACHEKLRLMLVMRN